VAAPVHRRLYYRVSDRARKGIRTATQSFLDSDRAKDGGGARTVLWSPRQSSCCVWRPDHEVFNPQRRSMLRESARRQLAIAPGQFALVIVSNDGRNKGLPAIFQALAMLSELPIKFVGRQPRGSFDILGADTRGRTRRTRSFLPSREDIEVYYAASDAYVGPSLEDTFARSHRRRQWRAACR